MQKRGSRIGVYTPREGYYKLIEVPNVSINAKTGLILNSNKYTKSALKVNTTNGEDKVLNLPIYAYYDVNTLNDFLEEIVLIEGRPLFNVQSIGSKDIDLKEGMIIHVIKSEVSGGFYKIEWELK